MNEWMDKWKSCTFIVKFSSGRLPEERKRANEQLLKERKKKQVIYLTIRWVQLFNFFSVFLSDFASYYFGVGCWYWL